MSKFKNLYMLTQAVYDFEHAFLQAVRAVGTNAARQRADLTASLYRALSPAERTAARAVCELKPHECRDWLR